MTTRDRTRLIRIKLEPNRHWTQILSDGVWTNEPGCLTYGGGHPERQVLGGQPYPLTTDITRRGSPESVSRCLGSSRGLGQILLRPSPSGQRYKMSATVKIPVLPFKGGKPGLTMGEREWVRAGAYHRVGG